MDHEMRQTIRFQKADLWGKDFYSHFNMKFAKLFLSSSSNEFLKQKAIHFVFDQHFYAILAQVIMLSSYVFVSVQHQEPVPAKSTILCVTAYFLASGMGIFVETEILLCLVVCYALLHLCFQIRPFCKMSKERVFILLQVFQFLLLSSSFTQRWTKCLLAALLPPSLTYFIIFNFKPTVFEIFVCLLHILLGE